MKNTVFPHKFWRPFFYCDDKINALLNNLEVTVSNFQAKRIGKESTSKSRPILVELANPWEKRKIYSARLNLRNKGLKNIFINEDLDKRQAEIYFHTRRAKKNNHIAKTWTIGGTVHIMKFGQNTPIPVECLDELSTLLPNFKIIEPRSQSNDETTKSKWSAAISREKTETCLITQKTVLMFTLTTDIREPNNDGKSSAPGADFRQQQIAQRRQGSPEAVVQTIFHRQSQHNCNILCFISVLKTTTIYGYLISLHEFL